MGHIQRRNVRRRCQQLRSRRVQGQTRRVRFVHALRIARQRAATGLRRLTLCGQRGPIGPGSGVERRPELLAHGIRPRTLVMQVEREGAEPDGIQSVFHDLQRRTLLRHEEHALPGCQRPSQQVRDGLRFAGARGALEHEGTTLDGLDDRLELRRVAETGTCAESASRSTSTGAGTASMYASFGEWMRWVTSEFVASSSQLSSSPSTAGTSRTAGCRGARCPRRRRDASRRPSPGAPHRMPPRGRSPRHPSPDSRARAPRYRSSPSASRGGSSSAWTHPPRRARDGRTGHATRFPT